MDWHPRTIDASLASQYRSHGFWTDDTVGDFIAETLTNSPRNRFIVTSALHPYGGTYSSLFEYARGISAGLVARGLTPGDIVAFQLPNSLECAGLLLGTLLAGGIAAPLSPSLAARERTAIVAYLQPQVYATATHSSIQSPLEGLEEIGIPTLAVMGEPIDGVVSLNSLLEAPDNVPCRVDPDGPALVLHTTGTTGTPKGIVHSHNTWLAEVRQLGAIVAKDVRPSVIGVPISHAQGSLAGIFLPLQIRRDIHLQDHWAPGAILRTMEEYQHAAGGGTTGMMNALLQHPDFDTARHAHLMEYMGLGGAPIDSQVVEELRNLGSSVTRMYGSTEHPSICASSYDAPLSKRLATDGSPLPGVDVRIEADQVDRAKPVGEILSRGPDLCVGTTDSHLTRSLFDASGWLHTGDLGEYRDGYLIVQGRRSATIFRGGTLIPAEPLEAQIRTHPNVADAAVVGVPDSRLGESVAAVVCLRTGKSLTLRELRDFLRLEGYPPYQLPQTLVHLTRPIPKLDNMKLPRRSLTELVSAALRGAAARGDKGIGSIETVAGLDAT